MPRGKRALWQSSVLGSLKKCNGVEALNALTHVDFRAVPRGIHALNT